MIVKNMSKKGRQFLTTIYGQTVMYEAGEEKAIEQVMYLPSCFKIIEVTLDESSDPEINDRINTADSKKDKDIVISEENTVIIEEEDNKGGTADGHTKKRSGGKNKK